MTYCNLMRQFTCKSYAHLFVQSVSTDAENVIYKYTVLFNFV